MARLLDKKRDGKFPFEYTPSHATDIRKTFERFKEEPPCNLKLVGNSRIKPKQSGGK